METHLIKKTILERIAEELGNKVTPEELSSAIESTILNMPEGIPHAFSSIDNILHTVRTRTYVLHMDSGVLLERELLDPDPQIRDRVRAINNASRELMVDLETRLYFLLLEHMIVSDGHLERLHELRQELVPREET
jgi:hypothetical protein